MNRDLQPILEIERSITLGALQDTVRNICHPLGYDRFVLFAGGRTQDEVVRKIYWLEGDWFGNGESMDATSYLRRCPVTRHILQADEPFFWTKTASAHGEHYRVVHIPRGSGIHGLQIPVFGHAGLEGAMSLGGRRIDGSPASRLFLTMIGVAAFWSARRLLEAPAGVGTRALSQRERQVLSWTAAGRRQADIAATLGLSERTVENHLRRARIRLGVVTTAQAVSLAIRNGEIED